MNIDILSQPLIELCETQFSQIGYTKPDGYFRSCYSQQESNKLVAFVAHEPGQYIGHVKLVWQPDYPHFRNAGIPEIQDLNVLPNYRKRGIGTALITACENLASKRCDTIGIGVGLHPGYNNAQRLYSKLGYVLDGNGVHYENIPVEMGQTYKFDDSLVILFTKRLVSNNADADKRRR